MGGINFIGLLSGFRAQTGFVAYWKYATIVRRLGEATASWKRTASPTTSLHEYSCIFLQTEENHVKLNSG